ncbi:MAG: hypothetical protein HYT47_02010 [Candidatus Vogelbacteria bacterium]|nr:hypothetical protein [Candidatus Vogelbacteria bacterium]
MNKKYRPKPHQSSERDQFTVVLEDLRSQFKVFGEGLVGLREHTDHRFDRIEERLAKLELELNHLRLEVAEVRSEVELIKTEMAVIRHSLITREELKFLETRVNRLEKAISSRH